jgi:hypothetical protein
MAIKIDGLTDSERELLDKIWAMKSREELASFYGKCDRPTRKKIDLLIELLKYAAIDEEMEKSGDTRLAVKMLKGIGIE